MLAATIVCLALAFAVDAPGVDAPGVDVIGEDTLRVDETAARGFLAARVDTTRLLDAIDLAPVRGGVRAPGPTRFGMHYWIDPEYSNNTHGVHFVIMAVLEDSEAARDHYDRLRARSGGAPDTGDATTGDRFALRFNADASAFDVILTRGNIYLAFRASGERDGVAELAEDLKAALDDPLIAPPGAPEPTPDLALAHGQPHDGRVEVRVNWSEDTGYPLPRIVLFRTDGELIAMADADGVAEVDADRLDTVDAFLVVAGWEDNRWRRWEIKKEAIAGDGRHD